jgi:hypothetical protein
MKIKIIRKLNKNEKYACTPKDVRNIFGNEVVSVYFGLSRDFKFNTTYKKYKKPHIEGTIITSAFFYGIEKMDEYRDYAALILFYAIKDTEYTEECRMVFVEKYLPLMYEWYQKMLKNPSITLLSGREEFLVEWTDDEFKVHEFRGH